MNRFFHGKWIWMVIYPLVFFIFWTYAGVDSLVCYALDDRPARSAGRQPANPLSGFDAALADLEGTLAELQNNGSGAGALWERFDAQIEKIEALDKEIRQRFEQQAAHLSRANLDEKVMKRQQAHTARYERKMDRLFGLVADIRAAQDDPPGLKSAMADLVKLLETRGKKKKTRKNFDPDNMPFQNRKLKPKAPRMDKESFERELKKPRAENQPDIKGKHAVLDKVLDILTPQSAEAAPPPPVPADLAETMEIQFTEDILAKAAELNHDPVKIYNWVRNNVEYVPTWGSIQGAQYCLETLQGNAFDTASLLIALLRASNIPARYVMGTVEIPIDQVMNWVGGFTDAQSAVDFMASGGVPVTALRNTPDGPIEYARIEHVWVEAFVDYTPSRASRHKDGQGDTWIEMDASFKQYEYTQGIDLQAVVPFDAEAFGSELEAYTTVNEAEGYISGSDNAFTQIQSIMDSYGDSLKSYIDQNMPNATVGDVFGYKREVAENSEYLLGTLPYKKAVIGTEFSEVPSHLRHKLTFRLAMDDFDDWPLELTKDLPEIAGKKITIGFRPTTAGDEAVLNSYMPEPHADGSPIQPEELPHILSVGAINVTPELRIDGETVAAGQSVGLGSEEIFTMQFYDPNIGSAPIINTITAGDYIAVGLNVGSLPKKNADRILSEIDQTRAEIEAQNPGGIERERYYGDLFYATALLYLAEVEKGRFLEAGADSVVYATLPSETIFGMQSDVTYLWGIPQTISTSGLYMDADHLSCFAQALDGDIEKPKNFMIASGMWSSVLENRVPEKLFSTADNPVEGISAVKALGIAASQGQRIYAIDQTNSAAIIPMLQINNDAKQIISNAIAAGKIAITSYANIEFNGWVGCGYIILDPSTGTGSYMISGGLNGALLLVLFLAIACIALAVFTVTAVFALGALGFLLGAALGALMTYTAFFSSQKFRDVLLWVVIAALPVTYGLLAIRAVSWVVNGTKAFQTLMWLFRAIGALKALKDIFSFLPPDFWSDKSRYAKNVYFLPVMAHKMVPIG